MTGRVSFALAFAALFVSSVATATSLRALTLPELVAESELVAHVRVTSATDRVRRVNGRIEPNTTVRFHVLEALHGEARDVAIEAPIGSTGVHASRGVVGWPRFHVGEEAVIFVRREGTGFALVGLGQGVFRVHRDANAVPICVRSLDDVEIIGDTSIPDRLSLAELRAAVLDLGGAR